MVSGGATVAGTAPRAEGKRVAVVTGAAGGLGREVCARLRADGLSVVGVDVVGDDCLCADVSTAAGNHEMVASVEARFGRLDVLVLNAGVQFMAPIRDFPEEEWDRLMGVLVKGPYLSIKHAWPLLTARRGARVIAMASALSFSAEPFKSAYVAAKHAVCGLVKVAAMEGGPYGLTANAVAPGRVWTPLVSRQVDDYVRLHDMSREDVMAHLVERYPEGRFVEAREVADAVGFLASEQASGISGSCVPVDLAYRVS